MKKMKMNKNTTLVLAVLVIVGLFLVFAYSSGYQPGRSVPQSISEGIKNIFSVSPGSSPTEETSPTDEPPTSPTQEWTEVGSGSGWSFVGSNNHQEWNIDLGSITLGLGGDTIYRLEVWRRWNFKVGFGCGDNTLIWCLHDSMNSQIWKRTDTEPIFEPGRTDIVSQYVVYDGSPWRMFIGNNFPCDVDCYWSIKIYEWK